MRRYARAPHHHSAKRIESNLEERNATQHDATRRVRSRRELAFVRSSVSVARSSVCALAESQQTQTQTQTQIRRKPNKATGVAIRWLCCSCVDVAWRCVALRASQRKCVARRCRVALLCCTCNAKHCDQHNSRSALTCNALRCATSGASRALSDARRASLRRKAKRRAEQSNAVLCVRRAWHWQLFAFAFAFVVLSLWCVASRCVVWPRCPLPPLHLTRATQTTARLSVCAFRLLVCTSQTKPTQRSEMKRNETKRNVTRRTNARVAS